MFVFGKPWLYNPVEMSLQKTILKFYYSNYFEERQRNIPPIKIFRMHKSVK